MKKVLFAFYILAAASMVACQTGTSKVAEDQRGKYESITVNFAPGSARISSADVSRLQEAARRLNDTDHLDSVTAAVWSDREFPVDRNRELPKAQRDLADSRITAIKDVLRPYETVTAHNMAEHANWFSRAVNADGAELESLFSKRDPDAMNRNDFYLIKENGGPSKAVVVFETK